MLMMGICVLQLLSCTSIKNGGSAYLYTSVLGDSLHSRIYTLQNGLTVYMSPYKDKPKIYTSIAVRAGS